MRRILAVIHGPAFGGAHNQLVMLREPLARRGFELAAAVPKGSEAIAERLGDAGVETRILPLHRLRATPDPRAQAAFAASFWPETRTLQRLIGSRSFDVVQSHGVTNAHAAIAAHRMGIANVWQIFDTRAPMALRRVAMPLVLRLADAISCWGRELSRVHPGADRLGDRLVHVFPPVAHERFAPDAAARARARRELEVPERAVLIGTVGVRNPQKGHEWLVRAAAQVRDSHPQAVFRILGGASPAHGKYMTAVEQEARALGLDDTVVRFVDPGRRVPELLQAFDVFAMPSVPRSEGMPTAILEAMACAKPVVATDVGATRELIEDGVTGELVPALDANALAAAVARLVDDSDLRQRQGEAGRTRARREFDLETLADLHALTYERAIAHRRRR